jgi:hypothetical protein
MKKTIAVAVFLFAAAGAVFGQTVSDTALLNTRSYAEIFGFQNGQVNISSNYIWSASDEEIDKFGALNIDPKTAKAGDTRVLTDIPLEFALLSYYSPALIKIRPVQADTILPANNPKLADLKLGAALYQDIQVLRFLADTNAVGRYEGMLKFITDRKNVTRTEIEECYRDGIRGLIAGIVDEEFNKISFILKNLSADRTYNTGLTRNPQTGEYTLSYERPEIQNSYKTLTAQTLDALVAAMRNGRTNNQPDFVQSDINTVQEQAKLIPAVVYADWKQKGAAGGVDALALITETLTNFYLNPTAETYNMVRGIYSRLYIMETVERDNFASIVNSAYIHVLSSLNSGLSSKVVDEYKPEMANALNSDSRYRIFSVKYQSVR